MPQYDYACDTCGHQDFVVCRVKDYQAHILCNCGEYMRRDYAAVATVGFKDLGGEASNNGRYPYHDKTLGYVRNAAHKRQLMDAMGLVEAPSAATIIKREQAARRKSQEAKARSDAHIERLRTSGEADMVELRTNLAKGALDGTPVGDCKHRILGDNDG